VGDITPSEAHSGAEEHHCVADITAVRNLRCELTSMGCTSAMVRPQSVDGTSLRRKNITRG